MNRFKNMISEIKGFCFITPEGDGGAEGAGGGGDAGIASLVNRGGDNPGGTPNAAQPAEGAAPTGIPDKFAGKSPEEIVQAYLDLESRFSTVQSQAERAVELEKFVGMMYETMGNRGPAVQQATPPGEEDPFDGMITEEMALNIFKDPRGVLKQLAQTIQANTTQSLLQQMRMQSQASEQASTVKTSFYGSNPDLAGKETVVSYVADMVQRANPGVHPIQLLPLVAKAAREECQRLGIPTQAPSSTLPPGVQLPGVQLPGGARTQEPVVTPKQGQINDLVSRRSFR